MLLFAQFAAAAPDPVWKSNDLAQIQLVARRLLNEGEFDEVIAELTVLRSSTDLAIRKFAQEYLGVARQRKGQIAFARAEYERFIAEFATEPEADRVKMRLGALLESALPERTQEVAAKQQAAPSDKGEVSGAIRFDYRSGRNTNNAGETTTSMSLASADVDLQAALDVGEGRYESRVSIGHYQDLLGFGKGTNDQVRYLYARIEPGGHYDLRVGRQRARGSSVLGKFDGVEGRYQFDHGLAVSVYAGMPVERSRNALFSDARKFVGLSVDTADIWSSLNLRVHGLIQTIDGYVDRQTIGTELRYTGESVFAQGVVDYDVHFAEVNALLFSVNGNYGRSNFNASYDARKSPFVSTRNALIGQSVDNIDSLVALLLTENDVENLALDRSQDSQYATLGFGMSLTPKMSLSSSLSWFSLAEGVASGGLEASPAYQQTQFEGRMNFSDFIFDHHNLVIGARFSSQNTMDAWSFFVSSHYRLMDHWKVVPRLRVDIRHNNNGSSQRNLAPELRVDYENGNHSLYLITGYYLYSTDLPRFGTQQTEVLLNYLGYQYRF